MLKLESQVTSLALSKRLQELDVKQESLFYWRKHSEDGPTGEFYLALGTPSGRYSDKVWQDGELVSAFTVAELGEMLPPIIEVEGVHYCGDYRCNKFCFELERTDKEWICFYSNGDENIGYSSARFEATEADARAKMLIYLLENKLIIV